MADGNDNRAQLLLNIGLYQAISDQSPPAVAHALARGADVNAMGRTGPFSFACVEAVAARLSGRLCLFVLYHPATHAMHQPNHRERDDCAFFFFFFFFFFLCIFFG